MPAEIDYISISDLITLINEALDAALPQVYFEGEIAKLTRAASGHIYLDLKDQGAQVSGVIWKGVASTLDFPLSEGLAVLCHGRPNVYAGSGRFQIVINRIQPAGEGALRKRFLQLKARLEKEGFFAEERKRALPMLPAAIGVVTSGTGAVIHDIMVRIRERMPNLRVYLENVRVQGEGAAEEIAAGVKRLSDSGQVEVIIVARGGGSLQDLWAFNEEVLVKAIFASKVPVISGVGHEVDVTLADFAADVRAPTPTAAAEMVVPKRAELLARIAEFERRLYDTDRLLAPRAQRLDDLAGRYETALENAFAAAGLKLQRMEARLQGIRPDKLLERLAGRLDMLQAGLCSNFDRLLSGRRLKLERLSSSLEAINPLKVLERGFSLVRSEGKVIRSVNQLRTGAALSLDFVDGSAQAKVSELIKRGY